MYTWLSDDVHLTEWRCTLGWWQEEEESAEEEAEKKSKKTTQEKAKKKVVKTRTSIFGTKKVSVSEDEDESEEVTTKACVLLYIKR